MSRKKWHFRIFCHATKENEISHKNIPSVVEEYLEQCIQAGLSEVRIIHGRGVGVQRNIVRLLLDKHDGLFPSKTRRRKPAAGARRGLC
jgi:hypothetical protein